MGLGLKPHNNRVGVHVKDHVPVAGELNACCSMLVALVHACTMSPANIKYTKYLTKINRFENYSIEKYHSLEAQVFAGNKYFLQ